MIETPGWVTERRKRNMNSGIMCCCATHCAESGYHEKACCSEMWCFCWCHVMDTGLTAVLAPSPSQPEETPDPACKCGHTLTQHDQRGMCWEMARDNSQMVCRCEEFRERPAPKDDDDHGPTYMDYVTGNKY